MATVGAGVIEFRLHTGAEHRVFHVAKFEESIYVLHAFEKRTRRTAQSDIALAKKGLADLIRQRARKPRGQ